LFEAAHHEIGTEVDYGNLVVDLLLRFGMNLLMVVVWRQGTTVLAH
jgi:hypothetical protein